MNASQESSEDVFEFRLSKKKFLLNLIKLIPKMKKIRKKAALILLEEEPAKLKVEAPNSKIILEDIENICKVPHRRIGN